LPHVYIDSRMGHAYLAGEEGACRILAVCSHISTEDIQRVIREQGNGKIGSTQTLPPKQPVTQGTVAKGFRQHQAADGEIEEVSSSRAFVYAAPRAHYSGPQARTALAAALRGGRFLSGRHVEVGAFVE
jgi:hypothetical protein